MKNNGDRWIFEILEASKFKDIERQREILGDIALYCIKRFKIYISHHKRNIKHSKHFKHEIKFFYDLCIENIKCEELLRKIFNKDLEILKNIDIKDEK